MGNVIKCKYTECLSINNIIGNLIILYNELPVVHEDIGFPEFIWCYPEAFDTPIVTLIPLKIVIRPFLAEKFIISL